MNRNEIDIPSLPPDWVPVAYRIPNDGERILSDKDGVLIAKCIRFPCLIVQKTKPRRIVLEETEENRDVMDDNELITVDGLAVQVCGDKIWRIKEE